MGLTVVPELIHPEFQCLDPVRMHGLTRIHSAKKESTNLLLPAVNGRTLLDGFHHTDVLDG